MKTAWRLPPLEEEKIDCVECRSTQRRMKPSAACAEGLKESIGCMPMETEEAMRIAATKNKSIGHCCMPRA